MLASLFFGIALATAGAVAQNSSFSNPLKDPNGSDPFMVYEDGYYYLTTTTWEDVQLTRATTLEGLKDGETKLVFKDTDPDRSHNVWAPGKSARESLLHLPMLTISLLEFHKIDER